MYYSEENWGKKKRQKLQGVEVNTMDSLVAGKTYCVISAKSESTENYKKKILFKGGTQL